MENRESDLTQQPRDREVQFEKTSRQLTQEQLAEIYFSATGKQVSKASEPPVIIKVVEKPRIASVIPWIITSLAFLITAFSLFSTKRIFVDVKVIDEKSNLMAPAREIFVPASAEIVGSSESDRSDNNTASEGTMIAAQDFVFEGAAYLKSSRDKNSLSLVNSSISQFARATVNFSHPINLKNGRIVFYAKGALGGEGLALALKDADNMQAFPRGKTYPFPRGLTTSWQKAEISLSQVSKDFDPKHVTTMRFEFGSKDTGNRPGDTVFVRDIEFFSE